MWKLKQMVITLILIGIIFPECKCDDQINTWFKYSNDINNTETYGKLITVDMSSGYANTDGVIIYLTVQDYNSDEWITIGFPIGYWEAWLPENENLSNENKHKKFNDLDDYLNSLKNNGTKIEKK